MRWAIVAALLTALAMIGSGCAVAPKNTLNTQGPDEEYQVENEIYIDQPFGEVWDLLVAELSKSFFVVNNIPVDCAVKYTAPRPSGGCPRERELRGHVCSGHEVTGTKENNLCCVK